MEEVTSKRHRVVIVGSGHINRGHEVAVLLAHLDSLDFDVKVCTDQQSDIFGGDAMDMLNALEVFPLVALPAMDCPDTVFAPETNKPYWRMKERW
jgi:acetaldehyde dehydrogenase (acetylating)